MPTFKFPATADLRAMFAANKTIYISHNDGISLYGFKADKTPWIFKPSNGNQGMDAGVGDDWQEAFMSFEMPADSVNLVVKVTKTRLEVSTTFMEPAATEPAAPKQSLLSSMPPQQWLEIAIAGNFTRQPLTKRLLSSMLKEVKEGKLNPLFDNLRKIVHTVGHFPDSWGMPASGRQIQFKMSGLTQPKRDKLKRLGYPPATAKGVWFKQVS
jgi:hypothetical protein